MSGNGKYGKVVQVIGPVLDVEFSGGESELPEIYSALTLSEGEGEIRGLAAGRYRLVGALGADEPREVAFTVSAEEETELRVEL